VPGEFRPAQVPALVQETHRRMRAMAQALEAYRAENRVYPAWTLDPLQRAPLDTSDVLPSFQIALRGAPRTLTTPVAYLRAYPPDPFSRRVDRPGGGTFAYWTPESADWWILLSPGPDLSYNITLDTLNTIFRTPQPDPAAALRALTYDPTNGAISGGDIWEAKE
jgi:hypothetical protein